MCGIIGYKGNLNAVNICLKGLKNLEYRGYDSWGIASKHNSKIDLVRKVGKIGNVSLENLKLKNSNTAIAHTRWATHGSVTERNAHPHLSNNKKIAVVHNGIIENYQELRNCLIEKGFEFKSETDTEVIPNLIEYFEKENNFEEAVKKALKRLEGSYTVVIMDSDSDKLIAARNGSPLVIGIDDNEYFVASDVPAFLEHTKDVIYLKDNEIAVIDGDIKFFDLLKGKEITKTMQKINWTIEQAKKGSYAHFMLKEINEQKITIKKAIEQSPSLIEKVTKIIKDAYGIFFVGCGTSYNACVSASYQFAEIAKKHVNVVLSSEFKNYEDFLTDNTLMVALSQSGETADTIDAIKSAKKKGVKVISIVNVMGSTITRLSDITIMMNSGPEICVLSTKSYTSQLAILLLLAYSVVGEIEEGRELIKKVAKSTTELIDKNIEKLSILAKELKESNDIFLIGRNLAYPSALEGALKIKEVSYIHAEGFAGGELKHGTIALIDNKTPVIVLSTEHTRKEILSNATEIKARGGYIIGVDSVNNEVFDYLIEVPEFKQANPLTMIIPLQILAYYLALERGCDPDFPKNLAKCVSVK